MMITYRHLVSALRLLDLGSSPAVIAHASLSAFGQVAGGEDTVIGALLSTTSSLMMTTFTYKTMITPEIGPPYNGITYGHNKDTNLMAEFFHKDMPADRLMGRVAEALRQHPNALRSNHPILSLSGVNAVSALKAQTLEEPLAPIGVLTEAGGWVLLLGVNHTVNTSIHYAEKIAGRKQFIRWALTPEGIQECPRWPGCSHGFQTAEERLNDITRQVEVGAARIQAIPLPDMVNRIQAWIHEDPLALLCAQEDCERCNEVWATIRRS